MGATGSSEAATARRRTRMISEKMKQDAQKSKGKVKLLLLGAGESGKSTLLKQMKVLYGQQTDLELQNNDMKMQTKSIRQNIVVNMKTLVENSDLLFPDGLDKLQKEREVLYKASLHADEERNIYTEELRDAMEALWEDSTITQTWESHRNLIQVQDALPFFMNSINRIFDPDYEPTKDDWLRVRVRSSGIVEEKFMVDNVEFKILDVGGQRNERRKWVHCFDQVQAVIYVAAINEYDQRLYEDETVNRVEEALKLFREVVNNPVFKSSGMILFLNKSDLYGNKLNKSPIRYIDNRDPEDRRFDETRFEDFRGPYCPMGCSPNSDAYKKAYDAGIVYFREKFLDCFDAKKAKKRKTIYTHVTCAMDEHNVFVVFNAVKVIILDQVLEMQGFTPAVRAR